MKRKLIFTIGSALALTGAVTAMNLNKEPLAPEVLKMAFPYKKPASAYEPARIHLAPEYIFLENVFSPLVELSPKDGQIKPGVAESYRWDGTELRLKIRHDLKTVTGIRITTSDAEFSLKRLLALPGNTHGNFRELICGNAQLSSVEDRCDGIRVEGAELVLSTTESGKTFLLPMLAAIDFAIIPKSSVDPITLRIKDFRNTSGPYYVERDSDTGEIQLRANPNHYHYTPKIPQVIELVPTNSADPHGSLADFKEGRVDFITTIDAARADDVIAFSRHQSDSVLHTTMNIRSFVLTFTERGRAELSSEERFTIGRKIRESFWRTFAGQNGYETSQQFFPAFGEGALDKGKLAKIEEKIQTASRLPGQPLKMALVRLGDSTKFIAAVREAIPNIEAAPAEKSPAFLKFASISEMPHLVITGPDTGFLEDIGLISYSLNAGYFGMKKEEQKAWLKKYMDVQEKSDRLSMLKDLHEAALSEPIMLPLLVAPYAALARKPWKVGLSQLYANNQLWLIQAN